VACLAERRNAYRVLVGKPEGKRHWRRPTYGREDCTRMDFKEVSWESWTGLICFMIKTISDLMYTQ
jgi:hypothetical protein